MKLSCCNYRNQSGSAFFDRDLQLAENHFPLGSSRRCQKVDSVERYDILHQKRKEKQITCRRKKHRHREGVGLGRRPRREWRKDVENDGVIDLNYQPSAPPSGSSPTKSSHFEILLALGVIRLRPVKNPTQCMATTNKVSTYFQKVLDLALHYSGSNVKVTRS